MDTPLEWSNTHLRCQVVAHIVRHVQFLFPLIAVHIQGNYGHLRISETEYNDKMDDSTTIQQEREDYEAPGPFSLVTYLQAMLKGDFYADEITLIVISMMWQVRVTVLNGETLHQIKIRHGNKTENVDLAVAHCSWNHYIPLGECTVIVVLATAIDWDGIAIDVIGATIVVHVFQNFSAVIVVFSTVIDVHHAAIDLEYTGLLPLPVMDRPGVLLFLMLCI